MEDRQNEHSDDLLDRAVEALRQTPIPPGPPPEAVTRVLADAREYEKVSIKNTERINRMKRIVQIATAACLFACVGILISWIVIGGNSTNVAFARVADVLDNLRSATYDMTSEAKGENGQPSATATGKGFFLAPSHQRIEISVDIAQNPAVKAAAEAARRTHVADGPEAAKAASQAAAEVTAKAIALMPKMNMNFVTIVDGQTAQSIMLMPNMKMAMSMDLKKMREAMKKSANLAKDMPLDQFEMVRRLVHEGSSGTGDKVEQLGKKEIDGREAVGFRVNANGMDMTLWVDMETARPIRIEVSMDMADGVRMVMNNFRYDVDLDLSLFSLEPPEGYSIQAVDMTMPVEEDLLNTLRTIAENSKGVFPAKLGMNKEVMEPLMAGAMPEMDKLTQDKLEAEMNKIVAKYGGKEKLREKYGKNIPPEILAEIMKATMSITQKQTQKQTEKQMPLAQKRMQGITFFTMLKPENDAHYVGGGVKLGTPDLPILWYKPTGAEKYRVIYADLSVRELAPDEVKKLSEATTQ